MLKFKPSTTQLAVPAIRDWLDDVGIQPDRVALIQIDEGPMRAHIMVKRNAGRGDPSGIHTRLLAEISLELKELPDWVWVIGLVSCGHPLEDQFDGRCFHCGAPAKTGDIDA